ncbi:MAG: PQQ-binding-like beta-propeller repeat protein [Planctomycetota bacterium]
MKRLPTIAVAAGILAIAALAAAEDWPKWRGPRGDNITSGDGLLTEWAGGGPREVWRVEVGAGYSTPVIVDDVIYLFTQAERTDTLVALSADDRRVLWRQSYRTGFHDRRYSGTRATPTVEGDRIYTYGGGCDLTCWSRADGQIVWRTNILEKTGATKGITWGAAGSPLIVGDVIYVQGGKDGPVAAAVNKTNGELLWKADAPGPGGYATIAATTVDGRDQLLVFGGTTLYGLDPRRGETLWRLPYETQYQVNAATPIIRGGKAFITHGYNKGKGTLLALEPRSVSKVWENERIRSRFVTPILEGDVMYANSRGTLKCVRWADGSLVWACDDPKLNLGLGGSLIRAGDLLITLSERGMLSLVHATPDGWSLRGQVRLFKEKQTWSTPVVYNGRLYVKGNRELVCLDIAAKADK